MGRYTKLDDCSFWETKGLCGFCFGMYQITSDSLCMWSVIACPPVSRRIPRSVDTWHCSQSRFPNPSLWWKKGSICCVGRDYFSKPLKLNLVNQCIHPLSPYTGHFHQCFLNTGSRSRCQGVFPVGNYTLVVQEESDPWSSLQASRGMGVAVTLWGRAPPGPARGRLHASMLGLEF